MDLRPSCLHCDSHAVLLSERGADDERRAACSSCLHEWTPPEDWWVTVLGGVIPARLDDGPEAAVA